jgi:hypothetical protein
MPDIGPHRETGAPGLSGGAGPIRTRRSRQPEKVVRGDQDRFYAEAKVDPGKGWVRAYRLVLVDSRLTARQKIIYLILLNEWERSGQPPWFDYTQRQLMLETAAGSHNTIRRDLEALEDLGLIESRSHPLARSKDTRREYRVTPSEEMIWTREVTETYALRHDRLRQELTKPHRQNLTVGESEAADAPSFSAAALVTNHDAGRQPLPSKKEGLFRKLSG